MFTYPFSGSGVLPPPWVARAGVFSEGSGTGYISTDAGSGYNLVTAPSAADGPVQVTLATIGSGVWAGIVFRYSDPLNYFRAVENGFAVELIKVEAGTPTSLYGNSFGGSDGDVPSVVLADDSISFYINGSLVTGSPIIDAFNKTATHHGLIAETGSAARWDSYSAPDAPSLAGAGGGMFF